MIPRGEARARRVVMLGLDGASWEWLRSPLVSETMPSLTALLAGSSTGGLRSTTPWYTGPAWSTITTGADPGRHGVFGFTDRTGRPNSSSDVSASRVWDYVGRAGGRSLVVNVPLTFPPSQIDGVLVAGMPVAPGIPYTAPGELTRELDALDGGAYVPDVSLMGSPSIRKTAGDLTAMTESRRRALERLIQGEQWDLVAVVFVLPDRIGHPWWKHLVPGSHHYDTRIAEETRREITPALRALDRAIEELLAAQPAGTRIVTCSDHGFGPLNADVFFDAALVEAGLIQVGARGGLGRYGARLARLPGFRHVPRGLIDKAKMTVNAGATRRAWTSPVYEQSVCLDDPSDGELAERVRELLMSLEDPSGRRIVTSVTDRASLFEGDFVERAPDLFPTFVSGDIQLHDGLHTTDAWVSREELAWGTHALDGIVAIDGPGRGPLEGRAPDIAATLLALLGLAVPSLDGRVLLDVDGEELEEMEEMDAPDAAQALSPDEEQAVMEHLRGLGYVE